ncbi:MAG: EamA family transporter [Paludibacteraceae bacterium]|nr:EamA family transporter [Paludibacteraceae bacterium]
MWIFLAFISAVCLGGYDISKKVALRDHRVLDVLTLSIVISSLLLSIPLLLSRLCPAVMTDTPFFVPQMDLEAHLLTLLKSCIVLSSWVFAYISLKHLPLSVVSPMQATRPMWTLIGALLIFGERLNTWQWIGVLLAIGSVFIFSISSSRISRASRTSSPSSFSSPATRYYLALALAILIGSCSGLYDKFMMRRYDHNAVQVYYTFYQALMMLVVWLIDKYRTTKNAQLSTRILLSTLNSQLSTLKAIALISVFLIISDNVYMLALRDPDSLIAVVSTIRRGGAVIGFAYGLLFLHEENPGRKIACMTGILLGLVCLALGSV